MTIGTLDGANVEMAEEMGKENMFIFGLTVDEVEDLKKRGYDAHSYYNRIPELKECIDQIQNGYFSPYNVDEYKTISNLLLQWDRFLTLADYESYIKMQDHVGKVYQVCMLKFFLRIIFTFFKSSFCTFSFCILG